jgi:ribosomal protein S18 acetylase RimI-like enzyme
MREPFRTSDGMRYRLLRAAVHDQRWLDELRRSVYRDLAIATFGRWDEARHLRDARECWDRGQVSIIEVGGERVGMIQILDQTDFVEIAELQIQPSHQYRGIAGRILGDIVNQAHKRGKSVQLSVALKNDRAYEFFTRYGFQEAASSETHHRLRSDPPS